MLQKLLMWKEIFRIVSIIIPPRAYRQLLDFQPLLSMLSTLRSYMRGIKIITNILTKKLVVASSLLGLDGGTNRRREKVE
jgi:hypothetical protein